MENIYSKILDKLTKNINVILMVIIKHEGSSPGKTGFKMMVSCDGEVSGSIGGGTIEYNIINRCKKLLEKKSNKIFIEKKEHNTENTGLKSGLICSGIQWIAYYPLFKNNKDIIYKINKLEEKEKEDSVIFSHLGIDINNEHIENYLTGDKWSYSEKPGIKNTLYIFGSGHVSLALSRIMKEIGFKIYIFDNRKYVETMERNRYADKKFIIDYNDAGAIVPKGDNIYIAVMTFAHKQDYAVIRQLINKKVRYLGMMGSENKVKSIFKLLKDEGFTRKSLENKINAPIGIKVKSNTPIEIAISIAAKIIDVKNSAVKN